MNNFNLNTSLYTITEIENLFNLKNPYTKEDIVNKRYELQDKIKKMDNISNLKQERILVFLNNIYNKLNKHIEQQNIIITSNNSIYNNNNNNNNINNNNNNNNKLINSNNIQEIINNSNLKTVKRSINIDSIFRNDYYTTKSSNFSIMLTEKINKIISMNVSSIQIPLTYYAISDNLKNNTFSIQLLDINSSLSGESFTITIPDGNYTNQFLDGYEATIESTINYQLQNTNSDISNSIIYTVDKASGKSVFSLSNQANTNGIYGISINFNTDNINTPISFKLGWLLGFRAAKYNGPSIISEGICNISGPRYIYLAINDYQTSTYNSFIASYNDSISVSNIIGKINIKSLLEANGSFKSIRPLYDDDLGIELNNIRNYFGPTDIQKLTFTLYDEFGRIIDLNNMDWSLVVNFNCIYD